MTIVPPYIAPVDPFLGLGGAFPKTVLFAYQEGEQMHEFVERLRKYVVELSPYIDGSTAKLIEAFVNEVNRTITNTNTAMTEFAADNAAAMAELVTEFNTIVQEIVNAGITVSDPVMTGVATNVETEFRQLLNGLYSSKATQTAVETGRLAKTALDADYATKATQATVETGRLTQANLDGAYTAKSVQGVVETGRLSAITQRETDLKLNRQLYKPTPYALLSWRILRDSTIAGERQGHIVVLGDSIGSLEGHVPNPAHKNNWFGRMKNQIIRRYGESGTGIIMIDRIVRATPAFDARIAGSGVINDEPYGMFKMACAELSASGGARYYLNSIGDTTRVYGLPAGSGINSAHRTGVIKTFANTTTPPAVNVNPIAGYQQLVTEIPWGSVAESIVDLGPANTGPVNANMHLLGMESLVKKNGTFRVSNISVSGQSINSLFAAGGTNDETNGFYGLPMIDMVRADLLIVALGVNDWMGLVSVANIKTYLTTLIRRQRDKSAGRPGGDILLVWNPQPNLMLLTPPTQAPWADYRQAYYDVADAENVALVDLGLAWGDFAKGTALGLFSDGIHPNAAGAADMSVPIYNATMED